MKLKLVLLPVLISAVALIIPALGAPSQNEATPPNMEDIIQRFAASESTNKLARNNYLFTQDVDLMTIGEAGSITGRYKRVSEIIYDDLGNRVEKITYFPPSTLSVLQITPEDLQDISGVQPFALTAEDLPKYKVDYVGKERIDELDTYVFNVAPKKYIKGERYLEGKIWVDDHDLQIVKVAGKAVPEVDKQKFPHFETYRENIDGRFWFPTYTYADDVLEFKNNPVRLRMIIRYTNYKKFSTDIKVVDEDQPPAASGAIDRVKRDPAPAAPIKKQEPRPPQR
jgi:hypothetical protein